MALIHRYEGKENSMEFLNSFLEEETGSMRRFLWRISSPPSGEADDEACTGWIPQLLSTAPPEKTDLGRHLSCLHTVLFENVTKVRHFAIPNVITFTWATWYSFGLCFQTAI